MGIEQLTKKSLMTFLTQELGYGPDVAEIEIGFNRITVDHVHLLQSILGLTALIRDSRDVEELWGTETGLVSGSLRNYSGQSPVYIPGHVFAGWITTEDGILAALRTSREYVQQIVIDYSTTDFVVYPEHWKVWYPKTVALVNAIDAILDPDEE